MPCRNPFSRSRGLSAGWLLASLSLGGPGAPAHAVGIEESVKPGESFTLPGYQLSQEPPLCQLTPCPEPPLGGELVEQAETGISLFLPFTEIQIQHPASAFFFREGDWKVRLEAPNLPNGPFPADLGEFHEQHLELGSGVIGDQAGEGVVLYFPWRPDLWESARQIGIDLTIENLTGGTARERTYLIRGTARGGLPPVRLCPAQDGDERLDVVLQRGPTGFSASPFDGAVDEIVVLGRRATFHVAVVSELPADGAGVQGWNLFAALSSNLRLVEVTTAGTVVDDVDVQESLPAPPDILHPDTGLPQGEGFVATAVPAADDAPWTLPPVGTATVLRVTVETKDEIPDGGEVTGEITWRDNMVGADPVTGERTIPWRNNLAVRSRVHYPCTCRSARLVFRSPGFVELLVPSGEDLRIPGVLAGELPGICELIECLEPRFGEPDPNARQEDGFSFFISFSGMQILHPVGTPAFHPGDWELRLEDPTNQLPGFPLVLDHFREDPIDHGSGMIGDEPREGVVIFFGWSPAAAARDLGLDLTLSNRTDGPRERSYLIHGVGYSPVRPFRLCPGPRGDSRLDVIVQDRLVGSTDALFAGSTEEVRLRATPGEIGRGSFYPALVSNFADPDVGVQGWSLAGAVTGDLRVVSGRTVGSALVALSGGFHVFHVIDPTLLHPDTLAPQGEGFIQAIVLSLRDSTVTLPPRGTETVCEVTVETARPVGEGHTVRGRVEWRDGLTGRAQPVPNIATVEGATYHFCTCPAADMVFLGAPPDCNANGRDDGEEIATGLVPDCNANLVPDACDIEAGTSLDDLDRNGVPDECGCDLRCSRVADYYAEPNGEVHEAVLGNVRITEGFDRVGPVFFAVLDCDADGDMDLYIPRPTFGSVSPATLYLDSACRAGAPPRFVSLRGITRDAWVVGYDALGRVVGSDTASLPDREQVLTLASSRGIERVEVRGGRTCLLEVCWCCDPVTIPPGRFRRTDANSDGTIDISDPVSTLGFLFSGGPAPSCPDAADSNDDGRIDISDPVSTLNFLFLGTSPPPEPGPDACGKDPTPSQLGACHDEVCA